VPLYLDLPELVLNGLPARAIWARKALQQLVSRTNVPPGKGFRRHRLAIV